MSAGRKKLTGSQVISAEVTVGLFFTTALRIIQRNVLSPEGQTPMDVLSGLTRSTACVWFASNVKFLLFKSKRHSLSLLSHCISRLVAFLALLTTCCESCTIRGEQEQLAILDVLLLFFFAVSNLIVMALGHGHSKGSLKQLVIFTKPQRFFLQMDSFASSLFGLLWLMCPGWLVGPETTGSLENLQLHLTRAFGAMMVGDSFASFATQSQLDTSEASVFSSRAVGTVMLLLFCNQWSVWTSSPVSFVSLVMAGLWAGNSVLGYLASKEHHTGASEEEHYKQALRAKERAQLLHQCVTQRRAERLSGTSQEEVLLPCS